MKRILITGGTGFIGGHLVSELVKKNYKVRCLVRKTSNIDLLKKLKVEIIYNDLEKAIENVDTIYHLAGIRGERKISKREYFNINVEWTKKLLELAIKNKVKKFVYCSSVGVTGWPKNLPMNENSPYRARGLYHITKTLAEKEILKAKEKINCSIIRPVITYGKNDIDGMIFKLYKLIKNKKFLRIGKGDNYLHLVDVRNLIDGFLKVGEKGRNGEIYIVADEKPIRFNEIIGVINKRLNIKDSKIYIPIFLAKFISYFLTNLRSKIDIITKNRYYDINKAKKELNYRPKIDTFEGLREVIDWYEK